MARQKRNPDTIDKECPVCKKTFTVSFYLRKRQIYCSKACVNHDPKIIEKMIESQKETYNIKYGMHPMQTEETKNNLKRVIKEKYGVDWISSSKGWYNKIRENNIKKHGIESYNNIDKIQQTCMTKYGVNNYTKTDEYKERYKNTCLLKYGVPHASMGNTFKIQHNKSMFEKFMLHPNFINFEPIFTVDDYKGTYYQDYKFKCKRCNTIKSYSIDNGKYPLCPSCDKNNCSNFQNEIYEYIKSLVGKDIDIKMNDRTILHPRELDIVIPSLNLAFECDGILWHSEVFGHKNKTYHLQKTLGCIHNGYQLIHIYDNEWEASKEIVKSVISSIIGKTLIPVYGRKCIVKEISSRLCVDFLNKNHLQGADHSSIKLGLFSEFGELISAMTFLKSRFDTKIQYEMGRFCNKNGIHIIGGASKLFSYFLKNYHPTSIVSYNDRRYFDGNVYINLGFNFMGNTSPNYFYIIDHYKNLQSRMAWQKHKLKDKLSIFDPDLSEWENMKNNGFDRIWDCGNGKWVWTIH